MTRILIADDHAVVRAGLRAVLQTNPELELAGEASGGLEALELVQQIHPDVLVLDLSMPDLDGISVTRQVKETNPLTRILILTVHEDEALLREAIKAGASGYILKRAAESELVSAIQVILRGDLYVDPSLLRSLLDEQAKSKPAQTELVEPLTPREVDVLKFIVEGYTNRQIAEKLSISTRTVEGHRANLSEKLGLHSRVELVRFARDHGIID
jgi:two-component system, NarL family, response regulator NreC